MKKLFIFLVFAISSQQSAGKNTADETINALKLYKDYAEKCYVELVLEGLDSLKSYPPCQAVIHTRDNYNKIVKIYPVTHKVENVEDQFKITKIEILVLEIDTLLIKIDSQVDEYVNERLEENNRQYLKSQSEISRKKLSVSSGVSANNVSKFGKWATERLKGGYIMFSSSKKEEERVTINCLPDNSNILVYRRLVSPNINQIEKEGFSEINNSQVMGWNLTNDNLHLLENNKYQYIIVKLPKNFRPKGKRPGYISFEKNDYPLLIIETQEDMLLESVDFVLGQCIKETK